MKYEVRKGTDSVKELAKSVYHASNSVLTAFIAVMRYLLHSQYKVGFRRQGSGLYGYAPFLNLGLSIRETPAFVQFLDQNLTKREAHERNQKC